MTEADEATIRRIVREEIAAIKRIVKPEKTLADKLRDKGAVVYERGDLVIEHIDGGRRA